MHERYIANDGRINAHGHWNVADTETGETVFECPPEVFDAESAEFLCEAVAEAYNRNELVCVDQVTVG